MFFKTMTRTQTHIDIKLQRRQSINEVNHKNWFVLTYSFIILILCARASVCMCALVPLCFVSIYQRILRFYSSLQIGRETCLKQNEKKKKNVTLRMNIIRFRW